jgi:hypothetical protein
MIAALMFEGGRGNGSMEKAYYLEEQEILCTDGRKLTPTLTPLRSLPSAKVLTHIFSFILPFSEPGRQTVPSAAFRGP